MHGVTMKTGVCYTFTTDMGVRQKSTHTNGDSFKYYNFISAYKEPEAIRTCEKTNYTCMYSQIV